MVHHSHVGPAGPAGPTFAAGENEAVPIQQDDEIGQLPLRERRAAVVAPRLQVVRTGRAVTAASGA
ncbi:hypothetical protein VO63_22030 [Streptomyces showdoensis]|uniref:Uncharacterized protein n=1 Tax=Streptomyces showdoensis TaxID=68268 RepID=A0A2P2GJJ8_STREW|nr:hypothetical protein VO63_22030 [Streptomyces showdoensis]